ncbi:MAG: hypothetical protein WD491_06635 [Balneolales bacterium]
MCKSDLPFSCMVVFEIGNRGDGRRPEDKDWDRRDAYPGDCYAP